VEDRGNISVKGLAVSNMIDQRRGSDVNLNDLIEDSSRKNYMIFIVIIAFIVIRSSRKGIRFTHGLPRDVCDGEMELGEV